MLVNDAPVADFNMEVNPSSACYITIEIQW